MNILSNPGYTIWICIGLHLIADFVFQIQGNLHKFKCVSWWSKQVSDRLGTLNSTGQSILEDIQNITDNEKRIQISKKFVDYVRYVKGAEKAAPSYINDFIAGLMCHCVMWGVVTFWPLMFVVSAQTFSAVLITNIIIHAVVDHYKCNKELLTLCADQAIHLIQVGVTVVLCCYFFHV
jgi:hypothetical protein